MREILLVSIAGPDRAGISASLTAALAAHQVNILDVSQAVIHDQLTLGLVIETGGENDSALLMRAVVPIATISGCLVMVNLAILSLC